MVPDPYDDDDDQPTLQRPTPASGHVPRHPGVPARFSSGMRAALATRAPLEELGGPNSFPDEDDTAVDRVPLPPSLADDTTATELLEETATRLPDDVVEELSEELLEELELTPADTETATMMLPPDVATVLRRASVRSEPPPSPIGDTTEAVPPSDASPWQSPRDDEK